MKRTITYFIAATFIASSLYSQDEKKSKQVQNFKHKYPGELSIQWDKASGGPKRIIGNNIHLKSQLVDKTNIHGLTKDFIDENGDLLNLKNTEVELKSITELENKFIVTYQQVYNKIPLWNVKLKLKIATNGQVLMIKSPCFNNPIVSVQANITVEEAIKIAATSLNIEVERVRNGELLIYPQKRTGKLYLCWHIEIEDGINKGVMIDAQTGQKIFEYDLYRNAEIRGTVGTTTWSLPGETDGSPDITPYCKDLKVKVTGVVDSAITNSSGYYSITVPSAGDYTVISTLDGPHCWVTNYTGPRDSYSNTASTSSDHNWSWQNSEHYNEYFMFHYMNGAWHEFNEKVSGFSSSYWFNNKMGGAANVGTGVNGAAYGTSISISSSNHYGGTVYHEYSHNVIYKANDYWLGDNYNGDGFAMDEGLADYYSCSFRNDSLMYGTDRRLDTKLKYPGSGGPHTRGQIIGGACWDLGNKSGMSHNSVNALVFEAITNMEYEETFGDFMDEVLNADDDDGNIFNGTPHDNQIFEAFDDDHWILGAVVADTIYRDMTWEDDIIVLGDVTIPSGITLEIEPGVNMTFAPIDVESGGISSSKSEIIVNGTFKADNTTFSSSSANAWYGVRLTSTATNTSYLNGCTITNAEYPVHINNSDPTVDGCTISGGNKGIYIINSGAAPLIKNSNVTGTQYALYVSSSAQPTIDDCKFTSPSWYPAYITNGADGEITRCFFRVSGTPTYNYLFYTAGTGTNPWIGDGSYDYGCLFDLGQTAVTRAVYVAGGSPKLGDNITYIGGYNDFLNRVSGEYYVYNTTGSTIKAENNYWGAPAPQDTWFYGSVDKTPYFSTSQSAGPTWKRAADPIVDAIAAYRNHDYQNAKDYATQALSEKGDSQEAAEALFYFAKASFRLGTLKEDLPYIESYLTAKDAELAHQARNWVAFAYASQGDLKKAEGITFQSPKGTLGERELLLQLISYYAAYGMETEVGRLEKEFLAREFPDDTKDRQDDLAAAKSNADLGMFDYETQPREATQGTASEETSLVAYPNPFNASTKLAFRTEDAGHASLTIYNTLGQKVRTLFDAPIQAGRHEVVWDGRDQFGQTASTGIYLCRLLTDRRQQTMKILMVK